MPLWPWSMIPISRCPRPGSGVVRVVGSGAVPPGVGKPASLAWRSLNLRPITDQVTARVTARESWARHARPMRNGEAVPPTKGDPHELISQPAAHSGRPWLRLGSPHLPEGFTYTFTSRYVDTSDVRLHAVIGGGGPPLLLIHGCPGSLYYWRLVLSALAWDFQVIAVDQRGIGLSDKPEAGYDTGTSRTTSSD